MTFAEDWKEHALQVELPLVQGSISVSAWPGLCQHLGELPPCVTAQELRETLWQQARCGRAGSWMILGRFLLGVENLGNTWEHWKTPNKNKQNGLEFVFLSEWFL